eukprot:CAMPEP_0115435906 /NCGR_PEP_ID=MMETSP0271-20121206/33907_1 /TAXON_ID=71861 /ORGANISM="Scrippsiella trochoidea, Strain CCMP3099" /LENGTH=69 /DNA_ID=CAMNT_0002861391 /DNA_START=173 /DNA_END=382 /DNA_ORIENTATION=+
MILQGNLVVDPPVKVQSVLVRGEARELLDHVFHANCCSRLLHLEGDGVPCHRADVDREGSLQAENEVQG